MNRFVISVLISQSSNAHTTPIVWLSNQESDTSTTYTSSESKKKCRINFVCRILSDAM